MPTFHSPYFWRSYAAYVLLGALAMVVACLLQLVRVSGDEREEALAQLRVDAELLAVLASDALRRGDSAAIKGMIENLAGKGGLRVTLVNPAGEAVADTHESPQDMENLLRSPEMQLALTRGFGQADHYSETLAETFVYAALPVVATDTVLGVARVGRALKDIDAEQASRRTEILLTWGALLPLILAAGVVPAWRRTRTLDELTQITDAIAQGDFERRVAESHALGMKGLVDAINQTARNSARRVSLLTADRNRLATVFTGMVEGVVDVDQKQNIIHINDAAATLLGVNRDRCMGKPVWQEIRNQQITMALDEAIQSRSVIKSQIDYPREHDQRVIDIYVASLSDDQGGPIGAVLVLHDVTEIKNLERIRTDFVANASHELKTPITAIRGLSETVVGDQEVDRATLMQFMERIHAQSIRLSQLVSDLMTISRLEADQTPEFQPINFNELVNRAVSAAQPAAEAKGHRLASSVTDHKLEVMGDRQHLSQLVDNLLDNAIKYTPEKGIILVRLRHDAVDVILDVEDSGIGISPQYQQRVFERFYRVDKARSQSLGGTGLGLSIVKNIAEKHKGNVSVVSQLGVGSVFTFRMPFTHHSAIS